MVIKSDLYDIAKRLKEIDSGYFVVYNEIKSRFEVHNRFQGKDTLSFVVPYPRLDARVIDFALKYRICNINKIAKEIEEENLKIEREEFKRKTEEILSKF